LFLLLFQLFRESYDLKNYNESAVNLAMGITTIITGRLREYIVADVLAVGTIFPSALSRCMEKYAIVNSTFHDKVNNAYHSFPFCVCDPFRFCYPALCIFTIICHHLNNCYYFHVYSLCQLFVISWFNFVRYAVL